MLKPETACGPVVTEGKIYLFVSNKQGGGTNMVIFSTTYSESAYPSNRSRWALYKPVSNEKASHIQRRDKPV